MDIVGYNPVRKLTKSHTSLTGKVASNKNSKLNGFESSLERDFILITDFNPNVSSFIEQPLHIDFELNGESRRYTPDFLVFYKNDQPDLPEMEPLLVEIKYRDNLWKNLKELKPGFLAAMKHCDRMGWRFKILSEVEIRNEYLFNAKFLRSYNDAEQLHLEDINLLLDRIKEVQEITPTDLIGKLSREKRRKSHLLFTLWYLVANHMVEVDLSHKITMNSLIRSVL